MQFTGITGPSNSSGRASALGSGGRRQAIPKALKLVPVATLLGAQHYKASTGFSSPNKYCTTNIASLTKRSARKSLIIIIVCIYYISGTP